MKMRWILFLMIFSLLIIPACGGGGGTSDSGGDPGGDPGGGNPPPAGPAFSGFNFPLSQGDFWEYRWSYYYNSWAQGSSPSTSADSGRFRLTLGNPVVIGGTTAYPIQFEGRSGQGSQYDFRPRWNYIAIKDNVVYGSENGSSLSVVFDAQNGFWPGGGFFADFGSSSLVQASTGSISNDYISTTAIQTGFSDSQSQCQYYPGIGNICGDSSYNWQEKDYLIPDVGPAGYKYYNSYSDCGGFFCSGATRDHDVGLVASSSWGDAIDHDLEAEPDDSMAAAMLLSPGVTVIGDTSPWDPGYNTNQIVGGDYHSGEYQVEDLYKIIVPRMGGLYTRNISVSLQFEGTPAVTDLDLYLFNASGGQVSNSIRDNDTLNFYVESINVSVAGTYYVGVEAHRTDGSVDGGRVEYSLTVNW